MRRHRYVLVVISDGVLFFFFVFLHCWVFAGAGFFPYFFLPRVSDVAVLAHTGDCGLCLRITVEVGVSTFFRERDVYTHTRMQRLQFI